MKQLEFDYYVVRLADHLMDVRQSFAKMSTLEHLFAWIRSDKIAGEIDLLPQDEFTHDVTVKLKDGRGYLVVGVT